MELSDLSVNSSTTGFNITNLDNTSTGSLITWLLNHIKNQRINLNIFKMRLITYLDIIFNIEYLFPKRNPISSSHWKLWRQSHHL